MISAAKPSVQLCSATESTSVPAKFDAVQCVSTKLVDDFDAHRATVRERYSRDELAEIELALDTLTTSLVRIQIFGGTARHENPDGGVRVYRIVGARTDRHAMSLTQRTFGDASGPIRCRLFRTDHLPIQLVDCLPPCTPGNRSRPAASPTATPDTSAVSASCSSPPTAADPLCCTSAPRQTQQTPRLRPMARHHRRRSLHRTPRPTPHRSPHHPHRPRRPLRYLDRPRHPEPARPGSGSHLVTADHERLWLRDVPHTNSHAAHGIAPRFRAWRDKWCARHVLCRCTPVRNPTADRPESPTSRPSPSNSASRTRNPGHPQPNRDGCLSRTNRITTTCTSNSTDKRMAAVITR